MTKQDKFGKELIKFINEIEGFTAVSGKHGIYIKFENEPFDLPQEFHRDIDKIIKNRIETEEKKQREIKNTRQQRLHDKLKEAIALEDIMKGPQ